MGWRPRSNNLVACIVSDLLVVGTAALCWGAAAIRFRAVLQDHRNAALRSLWFALAVLGLALTVFIPPVCAGLDRVLTVPNAAELVGHCLVLVSAWHARHVLLRLAQSGRSRRGARIDAGLLIAVMVALPGCSRALPSTSKPRRRSPSATRMRRTSPTTGCCSWRISPSRWAT